MKFILKSLLYAGLLTMAVPAFAQNTNVNANSSNSNSTSGASANSTSTSGATNAGNAQNITVNNPAIPSTTTQNINERVSGGTNSSLNQSGFTSSDVTVRTTPTVYAPPVSGGNPCTLAVSGGVSVIGWGATAGGTFVDQDCANRQKIAMIWNAGFKGAAKELMCNDRDTYNAFKTANEPCAMRPDWEPKGAVPPVAVAPPRPVGPPPAPMVQAAPKQYPRCDARRGITDNCVSG